MARCVFGVGIVRWFWNPERMGSRVRPTIAHEAVALPSGLSSEPGYSFRGIREDGCARVVLNSTSPQTAPHSSSYKELHTCCIVLQHGDVSKATDDASSSTLKYFFYDPAVGTLMPQDCPTYTQILSRTQTKTFEAPRSVNVRFRKPTRL
ncbi:hypothetical protein OH77DRAFT_1429322 [Trametes cingulata]|nr:hypothetical protein OH77DRAFT_1429322 [Trametes cingulata]